jgi:HEAT repeat protein
MDPPGRIDAREVRDPGDLESPSGYTSFWMISLLFLLLFVQDDPARLVERLSSENVIEREEAERNLLELGDRAIPALEKGAKDGDAEAAGRASRLLRILANQKLLRPRLRAIYPGIEERMDPGDSPAWTRLFLEATLIENSLPVHRALQKEDLLPLVGPAIRGAATVEEKVRICGAISLRRLDSVAVLTAPFLKGEEDQSLWQCVPECLRRAEPEAAMAALQPVLADPSEKVRIRAVRLLGDFKGKATLTPALLALRDKSPEVRRLALEVLETLGFPVAAREIVPLLQDGPLGVRGQAARTLARVAGRDAVPHLLPLLKDDRAFIRERAVSSLDRLVAADALPQLLPLLSDSDSRIRHATMSTIAHLQGKEAVPILLQFLEDKDNGLRYQAVWLLKEQNAKETAPLIALRLKDADEHVRYAALDALTSLGAREHAKEILPLLKDPSDSVQTEAVRAVGSLRIREAVPDLLPFLKHESEYLRRDAFEALDALEAPEAVPHALSLLRNHLHPGYSRAHAFLERVRDPSVVPALFTMLEDEDHNVRESAVGLLPKVGGKDLVPRYFALLEHPREGTREAGGRLVINLDVPDLVARLVPLLRHGNPDVRSRAAWILHTKEEDEATPEILKLLSDPDPEVRLKVIELLQSEEEPDAVPLLLANLAHKDAAVRVAAIRALRASKSPEIGPKILPLARDPDPRVREEALVEALGRGLKEVLPDALNALKDEDPQVRYRAFMAAEEFGDPASLAPRLLPLLDSPVPEVRRQALNLLGERAGDRLLDSLRDEDSFVRSTALWVLSGLRRPEALPLVLEALKEEGTRLMAINDLRRLGGKEAVAPLLKLLESEGPDTRWVCMHALSEMGAREVIPFLLDSLADPDFSGDAARGLGRLHAREAIPALARHVVYDQERNQGAFIGALSEFAPEETRPVLLGMLTEKDAASRTSGLDSLRLLKQTSAAPGIRGLLDDPEVPLRRAALETLVEMNDRDSIPGIVARLGDASAEVRSAAAHAAGTLGAREAIPGLRKLLDDPAPSLRATAVRALGRLDSREDVARILPLLKSDDPGIRKAAVKALGDLDATEATAGIRAVLRDDGSDEAARILSKWGVKEAVPDIARLLGVEGSSPERIGSYLCRLGSMEGVPAILRAREHLFDLNALRSPDAWKRLGKTRAAKVGKDWTFARMVEAFAAQAGLRVLPPADRALGSWIPGWEPGGSTLEALEDLSGSSANFILEGEELRLVSPREALKFWKAWWRDKQGK